MSCRFASRDLFQLGGQFQPVDSPVAETGKTWCFFSFFTHLLSPIVWLVDKKWLEKILESSGPYFFSTLVSASDWLKLNFEKVHGFLCKTNLLPILLDIYDRFQGFF